MNLVIFVYSVGDVDQCFLFFQSRWTKVLCFLIDRFHRWKRDFRRVSELFCDLDDVLLPLFTYKLVLDLNLTPLSLTSIVLKRHSFYWSWNAFISIKQSQWWLPVRVWSWTKQENSKGMSKLAFESFCNVILFNINSIKHTRCKIDLITLNYHLIRWPRSVQVLQNSAVM